jgi:quercetin dioxygenase-like cupin family protein
MTTAANEPGPAHIALGLKSRRSVSVTGAPVYSPSSPLDVCAATAGQREPQTDEGSVGTVAQLATLFAWYAVCRPLVHSQQNACAGAATNFRRKLMQIRRTDPVRALVRTLFVLVSAATALVAAAPWPALADDGKAFTHTPDSTDLEWTPCPAFMPENCGIAVLQGDPTKHNADVLFRLPSNTTAPHHWHTSAERMVLISGKMQVDYDGQEPVVLQPGTYAYGPARLPHTSLCLSDEDCILFIAFEEPVDAYAAEGS